MSDIFDDALEITEEAVEAQVGASDLGKAMEWLQWAAGAGNQYEIIAAEIERLKEMNHQQSMTIENTDRRNARLLEENKELTDLLKGEIDKINMPCAIALDTIWEGVMPKGYGPWEYPAFAARHIIAEFNDRRAK